MLPLEVKLQTGMTLITKNATTSEEQKELERLKKELSESMKK